jgi:hypothetical protein
LRLRFSARSQPPILQPRVATQLSKNLQHKKSHCAFSKEHKKSHCAFSKEEKNLLRKNGPRQSNASVVVATAAIVGLVPVFPACVSINSLFLVEILSST